MAESVMTPESAPRSIEELEKQSPFKLRMLAAKLGNLQSEEERMAFIQITDTKERVRFIHQLLLRYDQANAQAPTAAAPALPALMTQVALPGIQQVAPMVPGVSAAAIAAAGAATSGGPAAERATRTPRTPRTTAATAADAGDGAQLGLDVVALLTSVDQRVNAFGKLLEEASNAKNSQLTAAVQALSVKVDQSLVLQTWTLRLLATFLTESMSASLQDLLGASTSQTELFTALTQFAGK